jgi:hypothetical protein
VPVIDEPDPFAPQRESEPLGDDPFVRARPQTADRRGPDVTPTVVGPLARRDPDAPLDESGEYRVTGAVSFDEVLGRARRQGFLAGAAAGALAGAVVAAVLAVATSRPSATASAPATAPEPDPAIAATPDPAAGAAPARASAPRGPGPAAIVNRPVESAGASPPATASGAGPAPAATPEVPEPGGVAERTPGAESSPALAAREEAASAVEPGGADRPSAGDRASGSESAEAGVAPGSPAEAENVTGPAEARAAAPGPPGERQVTAALSVRRDELDACVAETPGESAAARGRRFRLLVVIGPDGRVSEARTDDAEIGATPLGACLVRLAQELAFAPFEGEPVRLEVRVHSDDPE